VDEPINQAARQHEVTVADWQYAEISKNLYRFFDLINERFFQSKVPTPVLSFKRKRKEFGHYVNGRNEIGVQENINISAGHLGDPLAEVLSTLAHEMVHAWQRNYGKSGKRNYHNEQCRQKMEEIGIPCNQWGSSLGMTDPFVAFLREHGVEAEARLVPPEQVPKAARTFSSLRHWKCKCMSVWATKEVHAKCKSCGKDFELVRTGKKGKR
jgi:hypothetical protein